jgi:hypothetical protein
MGKREDRAVTVGELKSDPQRAHQIYRRTGNTGVLVKSNKRGDDLSLFIPETVYTPDPDRPAVVVPFDVFRDQPTRFAHAASMGHTIKIVEEGGPGFVLQPPISYRNGVSPESLNCWWLQGRRPSADDRGSPGAVELTEALIDLAVRLGAIESGFSKMATQVTEVLERQRATDDRLDRLGVPKTRKRRKFNRSNPEKKPAEDA